MHFLFIQTKQSLFDITWALIEMGYQVSILEGYQLDPLNYESLGVEWCYQTIVKAP